MKLRNLLITAALFLSAGITFAGSQDYDDYSWNNQSRWTKIDVTLTKFKNQTDYQYSVYDVDAYNKILNDAIAKGEKFNNENQKANYVIPKLAEANKVWDLRDPGQNNSLVTVINLPEGTTVENFGVIGKDKVSSVPNISNNFYFYQLSDTPANTVYFGKIGSDSGHGNDRAAKVTFGQPLPTPVVTLLIALALGAGFVMYRNRKQQAEA
ncbi:MAG: hypothetical protein J6Y95_00135 [Lachnospiraceae bacterium]|nr:hypothetical protein [Lachnospiraceae bacterium]